MIWKMLGIEKCPDIVLQDVKVSSSVVLAMCYIASTLLDWMQPHFSTFICCTMTSIPFIPVHLPM